MTNRERIMAVFKGKALDRVPFMPFKEVMPHSDFVQELIDRGMGFIDNFNSMYAVANGYEKSEKTSGDKKTITYYTPVGEVSVAYENSSKAVLISSNPIGAQTKFMIKDVKDYEAAIYILDHTDYPSDPTLFEAADNSIGENGIIHTWTDEPPYMDAQYFLGLENWSFHQYDYPEEFEELLKALGRRQERRMQRLIECPDYFVNLGNLAGNFGPAQFEKYMLPYLQKYSALLKAHGKITTLHADANNLMDHKELVKATGLDVIEAFTPPPFGNLSLADARKAWGEEKTIWINFPESVFYNGYEFTKQFTIDMIKSDQCPNKIISLTEMGLLGVDENNERAFKDGITAIMDAIDVAGSY